jgi:hypothetical protein
MKDVKKVEVKEEKTVEVKEEKAIVKEEKPTKKEKKARAKGLFTKIINIVLWVILFAWMAVVITDFVLVQNEKSPKFCLADKEVTHEDGTIAKVCTGLGYKAFHYYSGENMTGIKFGPFWLADDSKLK